MAGKATGTARVDVSLARTDAKAPVPRTDGDRALSDLYCESGFLGEWLPVGASSPLSLQRSYFELLASGLPGPTGISPSQSSSIRSQDGSSRAYIA